MKKKIDALIVVEGKTDVAFLSSFLDSSFVITNGSDVPRETIEYIKTASLIKDVIVLTDPDFPGKKIRDLLIKEIPNLKHAFVNKEECIKNGKVGVAESNKEEILRALSTLLISSKKSEGNLTYYDLMELGLIGSNESSNLREKICHKYSLGHSNGKTLLSRLNSINISKDQLREDLNNEQE